MESVKFEKKTGWEKIQIGRLTEKNHEKSLFERPPLELDMYYATDLLYSSPFGLKAKGKTVGIQITSTHYKTKRFQEKRKKIREVNSSLINSQRKLKIF